MTCFPLPSPHNTHTRTYIHIYIYLHLLCQPLRACAASAQLAIEFFLKPLEEWRRLEGLSRIHLVGHSLGGYLAAKYAMWKPEIVASLTLVSPVGIPALPSQGDPQLDNTKRRFVHKLPFPSGRSYQPCARTEQAEGLDDLQV